MNNFEFCNPTEIIFGKGTEEKVGSYVTKYSKNILLHYGGGSIKKNGVYDAVIASLKNNGINFIELPGVTANPQLGLVYKGIEICRENNIDFILAVGGGSVIDSAKAIASGVCYDGDVWDFFEGKATIEKALPVGTVLTIAAAGSESSNSMVITKEEGLLKYAATNTNIIPKFSILNPEVTRTLPKYQVACGIADIMAHVMERYFTHTSNVDYTDRLCEATMQTLVNFGSLAVNSEYDYDVSAEIMWAGTIAHNNLLGTGRDQDWASHGIEHELSALYNIAHGSGLAIIFPAWMKYVYKENIDRFVQFAVRVMGVDYSFCQKEKIVLEGINRLEVFFKGMGLPTTLSQMNIDTDRIEEMALRATGSGTLGSFKKLTKRDVVNIYNLAK